MELEVYLYNGLHDSEVLITGQASLAMAGMKVV
jgi:hypothetical protein